MKISLKFLFLTCLLCAGLTSIQAQRGGGWNADPAERAKQQTERMTESLSLSEKQAEKVGEINLKYAKKMADARESYTGEDRSGMREIMRTIFDEQNAELKGVMTSDQYEQWQKIQEEQRQRRQQRRGERGGGKKGKPSENGENQG